MEKYIYDQKNGLWYEQNDDYCVPCLDLSEATQQPSGMWGRKELHYLKQHRPARYAYLLPSGRLNEYLAETDVQAATRFDTLIKQLIAHWLGANCGCPPPKDNSWDEGAFSHQMPW